MSVKYPQYDKRKPRQDVYPHQYTDTWTICTRCKKQLKAYDETQTIYVDNFPYCFDCSNKLKKS